ncbi:Tetraspanin family protein [Histomonas meleagridis]|uniref:Tetraspanin family protein n=1 Tax=Histomonas meleagridis TaxID=135588 RepID=UPI00355A123D|nr:Tetraspanin family protein [Histomonas meleagridis]KAH0801261.1 Tetraspanin family protein [Histomonas meleagridis]
MGKCGKFVGGIGFTLLTLITVGATVALFSIALYAVNKNFEGYSASLKTGLIIALVISIVVFIFGIYASFSKNRCVKCILSIIYIVYAIFVLIMAIVILALGGAISEVISREFQSNPDFRSSFEKTFNCYTWNSNTSNNTCQSVFDSSFGVARKAIGGCLLGIFFLLLIGIIVAFCHVCRKRSDDFSGSENTINTPLSYGW